MKKRQRRILAILLACAMTALPASNVMASVTYDAASLEGAAALFPGDSMTGITVPVMLGETPLEITDGTWTNTEDSQVYRAKVGDDGTLQITEVGYALTVKQGTAKKNVSDEEESKKEKKRHYQFPEEEQPEIPTDLAYYEAGDQVVLTADDPAEGMEFAGWIVESGGVKLEDPSKPQIVIEMPEGGATIAAQYQEKQPEQYAVTVTNGTDVLGAGSYTAGSTVEIQAADRSGENLEFVGWSVESGNAELTDAGASNTSFVMPEGEVSVTAQYQEKQPEQYAVTVTNGTDVLGAGSYTAGSTVEIQAADRSGENLEFIGWSVDSGNAELTDAGASNTSFVMPEGEVSVTANYQQIQTEPVETEAPQMDPAPVETEAPQTDSVPVETEAPQTDPAQAETEAPQTDPVPVETEAPQTEPAAQKYTLELVYASASGESAEYAEGEQITITADDRSAEGLEFAGWFVESRNALLDTTDETTAHFVMPAENVIIAATYAEAEKTEQTSESETAAELVTEEGEPESTAVVIDSAQGETAAESDTTGESETTAESATEAESETTAENTPAAEGETASESETAVETQNTEKISEKETEQITEVTDPIVIPDSQEVKEPASEAETEPQTSAPKYAVTVQNGAGSSEYSAGDTVTVEAAEVEGKIFTGWTADSAEVVFADSSSQITSFTMPEKAVTVTAEYVAAKFEMTLDDGSGSTVTETVEQGTSVSVKASDRQEENMEFDHWVGTTVIAGVETELEFADADAASTTFVMPGGPVTVTAVYKEAVTLYHVTVANGTINDSDDEIDCEAGTKITVTADPSEAGQAFSYWEVNDGAIDLGEDAYSSTISVTVDQDMDFKAVYEGIEYTVTVNSGIANYESCTLGTKVTLRADEAPEGMEFDYWYVDSENVALVDSENAKTTFIMPEGDVTVTANYRKIQYQLNVENGSSDAQYYYAGDEVTIRSNYPAGGREFSQWAAVSGNVKFADSSRWKTTFTMPASNVVVKAVYKDGPSANDNQILDLAQGSEYVVGDPIKFTASGAGMTNLTPNPGDYRYRPSSYQIANVTGTWQGSPYTTTMAIKATGEYTLKVIFNKDVYDGNAWVSDGTVDTKSVTFKIITPAEAVKTGDSTPVALIAGIMAVSCAVFIILLILFLKKRKK